MNKCQYCKSDLVDDHLLSGGPFLEWACGTWNHWGTSTQTKNCRLAELEAKVERLGGAISGALDRIGTLLGDGSYSSHQTKRAVAILKEAIA